MGSTLVTLSLYGMDYGTVAPFLAPSDLLRTHASPWLTVLPQRDIGGRDAQRLGRLGKLLTKTPGTAALLFFYLDDDMFSCDLYQEGKKIAACHSDSSWAKLGKRLNALFGDDLSSKAFRYASRCSSIEEQLSLLEQTIGTPLYDSPDEAPRTVVRCAETLTAIKKREALLRKRPNRYALTELAQQDWPGEAKLRQELLTLLRPQWDEYNLSNLLYAADMRNYLLPNGQAAYLYTDWKHHQDHFLIYSHATQSLHHFGPFSDLASRVVWRTKDGSPVVLFHAVYAEHQDELGYSRIAGTGYVSCLEQDGRQRWRFAPQMNEHQTMHHVYSAHTGVITLIASGIHAEIQADTLIWQIDAESGKLLRTRRFPAQEEVFELVYGEDMGYFVCLRGDRQELVILNDALEQIHSTPACQGNYTFHPHHFHGRRLWESWDKKAVRLYDLFTAATEEIPLETPSSPIAILSDGRLLGVNERENVLTVYDPAGRVSARCSLPGTIAHVISQGGEVYLVELRWPSAYSGFIYDALFDEASTHVWRLDPL